MAVSLALTFSFFFYRGYGVQTMVPVGAIALVYYLCVVVLLSVGRTTAARSGIRNRAVFQTRVLKWRNVSSFEVVPATFGRRVRVHTRGNTGRFFLAAPRDGFLTKDERFDETLDALLRSATKQVPLKHSKRRFRARAPLILAAGVACLLVREQPWESDWWPGLDEAGSLPRACEAADRPAAQRALTAPRLVEEFHQDADPHYLSSCRWENTSAGTLELSLQRHTRAGGASGSDEADGRMYGIRFAPGTRPVAGLGQEAWQRTETTGGAGRTEVWARRANVIVHVAYASARTEDEVAAAARGLARRGLGLVRLD